MAKEKDEAVIKEVKAEEKEQTPQELAIASLNDRYGVAKWSKPDKEGNIKVDFDDGATGVLSENGSFVWDRDTLDEKEDDPPNENVGEGEE